MAVNKCNVWVVAGLISVSFVGCNNSNNPFVAAKKKEADAATKAAQRKQQVSKNLVRQQQELEQKARTEIENVERAYRETQVSIRSGGSGSGSSSSSSGSGSSGSYRGDTQSARLVIQQVKDAVSVGPTLAVWIVDTSSSALRVTDELRRGALDYYASGELTAVQTAQPGQLTTAIVGFGEEVKFALDPPSADSAAVKSAWDTLSSGSEGKEATFSALRDAVTKYLPIARSERRQLLIALATDEAGDDQALADEVAPLLKKNEIPVYVVGIHAPWGLANPALDAKKGAGTLPIYGPESIASERVQIAFPSLRYGQSTGELMDSGFGPQALERVARAGGGSFIGVRPSGGGAGSWPTGSEVRFDPQVMKKYAPDYVSTEDYHKLLQENKARLALVEAAKLPKADVLMNPPTTFPKRNEAQMKKDLMVGQKEAARVSPEIDKLVETLQIGEGDRGKLTSPRWQAGFDLALGRALAAKVRADGYNAMLAALGRGKTFTNPNSSAWTLEPAETTDAGSSYQKMAEKARTLLQRVVAEHPGTPWAREADQELKTPMGWQWKET
jgi:hypothetical protein